MNKYNLVFWSIMLLLFTYSVNSLEVDISNNPLLFKVYNSTVYVSSINYPINNKNITVTFTSYFDNSTNQTVCSIVPLELAFDNYYIRNSTQIIDVTIMDKYLLCTNEKANTTSLYNVCSENLKGCHAENISFVKDSYSNCSIELINTKNNLNQKDTLISQKNKEIEDTKNQKFLFGIGGLILGIVGLLGFQGKLHNVKDKAMEEFGKSTAG